MCNNFDNIENQARINLKGRIDITKRARMIAEKRLKFYSFWLNFGVGFISIMNIFITIFMLIYKKDVHSNDVLNLAVIFYSLLLIIVSLIIWNSNFEVRSENFRKCYLKLDKLMRIDFEEKSLNDIEKKYHLILENFDNHHDLDNIKARILFNRNSNNIPFSLNIYDKIYYYSLKIITYLLYVFILISPLIIIYIFR
ncbi:SLATT domain-containing protein [Silvanigrella paludirubra]|uniref:SLATT domain-containing protein n=1 Tax=Silvanigrella paludirubra TaxID=2499159 RepID=A0A6N6VTN9_9BACT|nr:SLATT domain-containing protein [Silvanigrella paludirubra]KAB8035821.1 SLATT domain-containing protein [Silvanigrella paludirubra]